MEWLLNLWNNIVLWFTSGSAWQWFCENVLNMAFWLLGILATIIGTRLCNKLFDWLKTKTKNVKAKELLNRLQEIIVVSTNATTQNYVSNLKAKSQFDANAQAEAMKMTITNIKSQLTGELKSFVKDEYKDVEKYLTTQVENVLHSDHKNA